MRGEDGKDLHVWTGSLICLNNACWILSVSEKTLSTVSKFWLPQDRLKIVLSPDELITKDVH